MEREGRQPEGPARDPRQALRAAPRARRRRHERCPPASDRADGARDEAGRRSEADASAQADELQRANERVAQLEAENAALRAENAELRTENAELRAENRRLSGVKRQLEDELQEMQGGRQVALDEAAALKEQLERERRNRAALARQLDAV